MTTPPSRTREWMIDLPTRIHLWSAEHWIRHRTPSDAGTAALRARRDNLAVLREYRKSRQYPRNDTDLRRTPYFVDAAGRHCAVAHLMRGSGDHDAVRQIASTANLARIDDLDPVMLQSWAGRSGLTKQELARIQPGYAHPDQSAVNLLLWSALVLIPLASLSFAVGWIRPDRTAVKAVLTVATVTLCTVMSLLVFATVNSGAGRGSAMFEWLEWLGWLVVIVGPIVAAVLFAIQLRRGVVREDTGPTVTGAAAGALTAVLASIYLVLGAALAEPEKPVDPTIPTMYGDLDISFPYGFAALLIGLLCVTTGLIRLRRLA
ncbi:hypothetical protein [Kribbella catacumbae]|uniref:hypothetical protein n=1 Tax=Kribbella catacumbae TaxID=460086 RepID=UPI0012F730FC|nr:hypothetical protein [Kribbella catacumbae]